MCAYCHLWWILHQFQTNRRKNGFYPLAQSSWRQFFQNLINKMNDGFQPCQLVWSSRCLGFLKNYLLLALIFFSGPVLIGKLGLFFGANKLAISSPFFGTESSSSEELGELQLVARYLALPSSSPLNNSHISRHCHPFLRLHSTPNRQGRATTDCHTQSLVPKCQRLVTWLC